MVAQSECVSSGVSTVELTYSSTAHVLRTPPPFIFSSALTLVLGGRGGGGSGSTGLTVDNSDGGESTTAIHVTVDGTATVPETTIGEATRPTQTVEVASPWTRFGGRLVMVHFFSGPVCIFFSRLSCWILLVLSFIYIILFSSFALLFGSESGTGGSGGSVGSGSGAGPSGAVYRIEVNPSLNVIPSAELTNERHLGQGGFGSSMSCWCPFGDVVTGKGGGVGGYRWSAEVNTC